MASRVHSDHCRNCRSTDLMSVSLTIGAGPVRFCHCRGCETRWWTDASAQRQIALPDVLDRVAS